MTPVDEKISYSQNLPAPRNLEEAILVELALLYKYDIITTLPFINYASLIIAQQKPNRKLRLLVDLKKINNLISDDYINNNHPVGTMADAAQHMTEKKLFCRVHCSQAYHCLDMADHRSMELLAFNFASQLFEYIRLTQGLSRSRSAFSSFFRDNFHPLMKADQCLEYVDNIGIAANIPQQLLRNLKAVFACTQRGGLNLALAKCHFGVQQV